MLLIRTYVAQSAVEGVGVFASEFIPAGRPIWRLEPDFDRLISDATYQAASPVQRDLFQRYAYPSPNWPGFIIYEVDNGRFMNHSDTPNTDFSDAIGIARVDILAGEEITCNYAEFFDGFELLPSAIVTKPD